jgi:hypothetical protein
VPTQVDAGCAQLEAKARACVPRFMLLNQRQLRDAADWRRPPSQGASLYLRS